MNHIPEGEVLRESEWAAAYDPGIHTSEKLRSSVDELAEEEEAEAILEGYEAPKEKRVTEMPSSWEEGPDRTIRLGTNPGLRYDREIIEVEAGNRIEFVFNNDDDMQHNVVIVRPGTADEVGEEAMLLGLQGPDMHYVPENDNVLYHTSWPATRWRRRCIRKRK